MVMLLLQVLLPPGTAPESPLSGVSNPIFSHSMGGLPHSTYSSSYSHGMMPYPVRASFHLHSSTPTEGQPPPPLLYSH